MKINFDFPLIVGTLAMILLIIGTFVTAGSFLQKLLFVIGAPTLGITAFFNKQKMFTIIQFIVSIGALLAFFNEINQLWKYALLLGAAVLSIIYLFKINYFNEDKWGLLGVIGLACFAFAFATNAVSFPLIFNALILIGGLVVAVYSSISFFINKVKIAFIWIILNLLLCISPILFFVNML